MAIEIYEANLGTIERVPELLAGTADLSLTVAFEGVKR
jgi:hypothetical protein